jgi:hypothetical protein
VATTAGAEVSCAEWHPLLSPHLSERLVDARWHERLGELWARFPGDALVALETRLAEGAPRVDSSVRLASPGQARLLSPEALSRHHRRFIGRWGRSRRLGYPDPVSAVWLEFDLDGEPGRLKPPLICARLERRVSSDWLVDVLLHGLSGRPLGERRVQVVRRAISALPAGAEVLYAFSLQPRLDGVRIELYGLDPAGMVRYLESLAAPGLAARVARLGPLLEGADRYHLSLDFGEELLPRIGVECGWRRLPHRDPRWRRFLDRLVWAGLATAEKRDAVLAWPGYDTPWSAPRLWPARALGRGGYLVRSLSHVKLVSLAEGEPEAKAYLLFQHLVRRLQEVRADGSRRPSSSAPAPAGSPEAGSIRSRARCARPAP